MFLFTSEIQWFLITFNYAKCNWCDKNWMFLYVREQILHKHKSSCLWGGEKKGEDDQVSRYVHAFLYII